VINFLSGFFPKSACFILYLINLKLGYQFIYYSVLAAAGSVVKNVTCKLHVLEYLNGVLFILPTDCIERYCMDYVLLFK
jgi:hypothetical protein